MISPRFLKALQEIGKPAVPVFIKIIVDKNSTNRVAAIFALGQFGRDAQIAIPTLLDCLNDSDEDVVKMAAQTLGQLHLEAGAVVPALMDLIKRSDGRPRLEAIDALYYFGTGAEPALELLQQLRSDPLPETQRKAEMLVRRLRPDTDPSPINPAQP
jgi:HEAT repeat protein